MHHRHATKNLEGTSACQCAAPSLTRAPTPSDSCQQQSRHTRLWETCRGSEINCTRSQSTEYTPLAPPVSPQTTPKPLGVAVVSGTYRTPKILNLPPFDTQCESEEPATARQRKERVCRYCNGMAQPYHKNCRTCPQRIADEAATASSAA